MTTPPRITIDPPEPAKPRTVNDMEPFDFVTVKGTDGSETPGLVVWRDIGAGEKKAIYPSPYGEAFFKGHFPVVAHHGKLRVQPPDEAPTEPEPPEPRDAEDRSYYAQFRSVWKRTGYATMPRWIVSADSEYIADRIAAALNCERLAHPATGPEKDAVVEAARVLMSCANPVARDSRRKKLAEAITALDAKGRPANDRRT